MTSLGIRLDCGCRRLNGCVYNKYDFCTMTDKNDFLWAVENGKNAQSSSLFGKLILGWISMLRKMTNVTDKNATHTHTHTHTHTGGDLC